MSRASSMRLTAAKCLLLLLVLPAGAQQTTADQPISATIRADVIQGFVSRIEAGYVLPETGNIAVQYLRTAQASGDFDGIASASQFAEQLTSELRSITRDKHLAVYFSTEHARPRRPRPVQLRRTSASISALRRSSASAVTSDISISDCSPT